MTQQTFPSVVLHGDRVVLRAPALDDVPGLVEGVNDPVTQAWLPLPFPYTGEMARSFCESFVPQRLTSGAGLVFAMDYDGMFAGVIDLKRTEWRARCTEIGYWSAPWARGRGVTVDAVRTLARWVLVEQGFERVELRVATGNVPSLRVGKKAGFTYEGALRNAGFVHAGRVDLAVLSLVPADLAENDAQGR